LLVKGVKFSVGLLEVEAGCDKFYELFRDWIGNLLFSHPISSPVARGWKLRKSPLISVNTCPKNNLKITIKITLSPIKTYIK
jgi:hypothetical protein